MRTTATLTRRRIWEQLWLADAQRVEDGGQAHGAIVGKALASLDSGKGKIPVLVMLQ